MKFQFPVNCDFDAFFAKCSELFRDCCQEECKLIFNFFDVDQNSELNEKKIEKANNWLKFLFDDQKRALIVVDVQNDFISGSLAISKGPAGQNGAEILPKINKILANEKNFHFFIFTQDWHPPDHISFFENRHLRELHSNSFHRVNSLQIFDTVEFKSNPLGEPHRQTLWPSHCVQGTWGAELHSSLKIPANALVIRKGTNPDVDSYSAFADNRKNTETELHERLKTAGVREVFVCGLAFDVCVGDTCMDAIRLGYKTALIEDASKGLDLTTISVTKNRILEAHGAVLSSTEVEENFQNNLKPWPWAMFEFTANF